MNLKGLTEEEVIQNRKQYGTNELLKKKKNSFFGKTKQLYNEKE